MPLQLDIVTPEKKIFSGPVDNVYLPGSEGELGVLPMHTALLTALQPGELRYLADGTVRVLAVGSGFAEISQEKVVVLTDMALGEGDIDETKVEEALHRAEEELKAFEHSTDAEEVAYLQGVIAKCAAQLHLKRTHNS